MNLRLYSVNHHSWFIVPDCMVAPKAAIERYGKVQFLGVVGQADIEARELARIAAEFDAQSFAEISRDLAGRLMRSLAFPS